MNFIFRNTRLADGQIIDNNLTLTLSLFTGGADNIAHAGTYAEKLAAMSKLWAREAVSVATVGILDLLSFFRSMITAFAKACSKGLKGFFRWVEELIKGLKGGKKVDEVLGDAEKAVGMAEKIKTTINVEEFLASAKRLENIKPEEALKYLDEALVHFNHEVVDGVVVQIGNKNCSLVVQLVEKYLHTGKIQKAIPSGKMKFKDLANLYDRTGLSLEIFSFEKFTNLVKNGERGVLAGLKEIEDGHVVNFIKENGVLKIVDGQNALVNNFKPSEYDLYGYFKTVKL